LGIGASSIICPVYIAEIAPEKSRGRLGTLFQLGIVTGIFLTLFINKVVQGLGDEAWNTSMGWRWMLGLEALPAIAFLGLLFTVPESPRWLAQRGRLVDKAGRRPLLLVGTAVQAISLGMVGWLFHNHLGGTPLPIAIMAFIAAFAMALGPIGWLFCAEIFPNKVRGRAMSVASFTVWASCYIVAQTFPILNDSPHVGPALTFWIYSGISLLAFLMVLALVPETKGRSLEEIEEYWRRPPRELDPPTAQ
jgi:MFS family permease